MDAILRIEAALAAGPTEGEWYHERLDPEDKNWEMSEVWAGHGEGSKAIATAVILERNAAYIAACNPAAIREVLQTLASKEAELARLRGELIGYMVAVELMNTAMKDGINVHGAMGSLIAATDAANDALTQPPKEPT